MSTFLTFDFAPFRCSGVVYGTLLNDPLTLHELGAAVHQPPYKAPPKAPVLYLKPRNTHAVNGSVLHCPAGSAGLKIGATLGIVIKRTACRVKPEDALNHVAGYTIVNDVSLPLDSYYRPSVRLVARDGFCPAGPHVVAAANIVNPDALAVKVYFDGELVHSTSTAGRVRGVASLLADVSDFMTLEAGDMLLLGEAAAAPLAHPGQKIAIEIEGLGRLENSVGADA
jgi:5-oxopent-3-ene-1,2,5-tricarboxylate decarboxylase/2-hydroxyhepta-2,4-diene-1,7-dioate isomerase